MSYEDAVSELYRAPHEGFVAQRTRLSVELKAAGDNAGGARLAKLRRPPLSAWVVNQLWWQAREAFEELFASAQLLRGGDLAAGAAHRKAVNGLVARAGTLLEAAGHPANEATLRRVTATLAALAAAGSFDPDPPGALSSDRDPPGFGAAGFDLAPPSPASKPRAVPGAQEAKRREEAEQREQAESAAERRRLKEQRTQRQAERHRLEVALRAAKREGDAQSSKIERLGRELAAAEESLKNERARIEQIEARLSELETQD